LSLSPLGSVSQDNRLTCDGVVTSLLNSSPSLYVLAGKTFIAAVVMYNYYRWFPNSKIIFVAPTRPLVQQQVQACHKVSRSSGAFDPQHALDLKSHLVGILGADYGYSRVKYCHIPGEVMAKVEERYNAES